MQTALVCGAPMREDLEDVVLGREAAGDGDVGDVGALGAQTLDELVGHALQVEGGNAPLLHHAPRAHAGAAGGAVDREQVDLGVADAHLMAMASSRMRVGAGLERDALGAQVAQALDLVVERLLIDEAEAASGARTA